MKASVKMVLVENLKVLRLSTMVKHLEEHIRQANESGIGVDEFLLNLTEIELQVRGENALKRRLTEAKFPLQKTLDTFNCEAAPGLDRRLLKELSECEYIRHNRNVVFAGKTGTGKTHMAIALGMEACKQGLRTHFVSAYGLVNKLVEARGDKELSRIMQRYARYNLLIVDELGYVPFSREGAELLFQVLAERHEKASTIVTTNLGFGDWTQVFGDANLTAALLDRLTHKAHIINCTWDSYRFMETMKIREAASAN